MSKTLEHLKWEYLCLSEDVDSPTRHRQVTELLQDVPREILYEFRAWLLSRRGMNN